MKNSKIINFLKNNIKQIKNLESIKKFKKLFYKNKILMRLKPVRDYLSAQVSQNVLLKKIISNKLLVSSSIFLISGGLIYLNLKESKYATIEIPEIPKNIQTNKQISENAINNENEKEESAVDLLKPLLNSSELSLEVPKGRTDPFDKVDNFSLTQRKELDLNLEIRGILVVKEKKYALTKSDYGSALICSSGRGKCDEFSSDILPINWAITEIDENTGCAKFLNIKNKEKLICMTNF
tara:strand:+ start:367 stop:1080 length:714 start_codon:yes stop_codon:yes gene_type:complete